MKKLSVLFAALFIVAISFTSCKKVETTVSPQDSTVVEIDSVEVDSMDLDTVSTEF